MVGKRASSSMMMFFRVFPSQSMVGKLEKKALSCSCEECLGVFASNASNLANEAGGCPSFSSTCNASVDA